MGLCATALIWSLGRICLGLMLSNSTCMHVSYLPWRHLGVASKHNASTVLQLSKLVTARAIDHVNAMMLQFWISACSISARTHLQASRCKWLCASQRCRLQSDDRVFLISG